MTVPGLLIHKGQTECLEQSEQILDVPLFQLVLDNLITERLEAASLADSFQQTLSCLPKMPIS